MNSTPANPYDAFYFATSCGAPYERSQHWLTLFNIFADHIVRELHPTTALDAGCAMGFLVESLRDRGVEAFGIDVSTYAIERVREDIRPYCAVGSITTPFNRRYDLIVSIEVLEHLTPAEAEQAIANFCAHTDRVLFSSTPLDHKEATHINVHPPEDWAELFARNGFGCDVDFDASFITQWAALFRRSQASVPQVVRDYERKFWWTRKENADLRAVNLEMRNQLATLNTQQIQAQQKQAELIAHLHDAAQKEAELTARLRDAEQKQSALTVQLQTAEQRAAELSARLTEAEQSAAGWRTQFESVTSSTTWRLLRRIGQVRLAIAPRGSTRERVGRFIFRVLRIK